MHLDNRRAMFLGFLLLVALPLLGAGCKKESSAPLMPQDSGEPVADANPPVTDSGPVIPEGWQVYRSESLGVSFWYRSGWDVAEARGNIFVSDSLLPEPLPLDLLDVPIVLNASNQGPNATLQFLRQNDPSASTTEVAVGGRPMTKLTYRGTDPDSSQAVLYMIPYGNGRYLDVSASSATDGTSELRALLESLRVGGGN